MFLVTLSSRDLKVSTHGIPLLAVVCSVVWGLGKVAEAGPAIDFPLEFLFELYIYIYEQGSKDAMKGFNYDPPSLLKICDLLCVAIGGLM